MSPHYSGRCIFALIYLAATMFALPAFSADATLVLRNGRIWTGDPAKPWAEAVAIAGNRIDVVGSNADIASRIGKSTQVIDLGGKLASPGFNDAHTHFLDGSLQLSQVDLFNAGSLEEMQKRIAAWAN